MKPRPAHRPLIWGEPTERLTVRLPRSLALDLAQAAQERGSTLTAEILRRLGYQAPARS